MSQELATAPRLAIARSTNVIFTFLAFGSCALMLALTMTDWTPGWALGVYGVTIAFTGLFVPQLIQKLRNWLARA